MKKTKNRWHPAHRNEWVWRKGLERVLVVVVEMRRGFSWKTKKIKKREAFAVVVDLVVMVMVAESLRNWRNKEASSIIH
jgi:hypothetical protein